MFREQLMKALDTAVKNFNGGMGDNDAVIKAAADSQFNSDQTQRLLETYNTAKSIYFFKSANDRRDRFPLADPGVVLPALFSGVAKAAPKAAGLTDQAFYSEREFHYDGKWAFDQFGARQVDEASMEKAAGAPGTNLSLDTLYRSLKKHATTTRQTAERCTSTADFCQYQHDDSLRKLAAFVSQAYHEPDRLAQVEHYMWSLHGRDLAEPVVQDLLTCLPATSAEKRAGDRLERLPTDFEQRHPAEAALAKEAFEARFATGQLRALAVTFEKEAAGMLRQWNDIAGFSPASEPAGSMSGFFAEALRGRLSKQAQATGQSPLNQMAYPPAGQPLKAKQPQTQQTRQPRDGGREKEEGEKAKPSKEKAPESLMSKVLAGAGTAVGGGVSKALETPIQRAMASLTSGGEAEDAQRLTGTLRNMQRKLLLEDLLINDPLLSGEDPQAVITAYQTMVNVAPEVSLNKEIVRSVIRTAVNAVGFSSFDAKNIAELEGEMRKNLGYTLPKAEGARA